MMTMLNSAVGKYTSSDASPLSARQSNLACATPQFSQQKKINFEEASVVKALKHNDEHWEDTCVILIEAACRTLKKCVGLSQENKILAQEFWENFTTLMADLIDLNGTLELVKTIFKSIQDLNTQCFEDVVSQSSLVSILKSTTQFIS